MPAKRFVARRAATFILAAFLVAILAACGGPAAPKEPSGPPPDALRTITGSISLPAGHALNLASLTVSTPMGTSPVSSSGEFSVTVLGGAASEVGVETAEGELLLLGVTNAASDSDTMLVSLTSTAEALLYYLVGGMWLPEDQQDKVRSLLGGAPEATNLAAELERQLLAGGNGAADPDAGVLAALDAVHADLLGDARLAEFATGAVNSVITSSAGERQALASFDLIHPSAVDGTNILIQPTTVQAGAEVLHNPSGAGAVAQNSYRRPAALLAYEVAWEDADKVEHEVSPPLLIERVEVPSTGQLEFFNALIDVVTGNSPWSPVLSPPLALAGHEGASRTHYQLMLIGPSATTATRPIMEDPRFTSFHDDWNYIMVDKSVELFLDDLLLPLMEVYGLGRMAKMDAKKLSNMRDRVRIIHDKHLVGLGVYLTKGHVGYAHGLKFVLEELAQNRTFRLDMMEVVKEALAESDKNKAAIDAMERRLSSRASATAIAAAVQTALVSGDVAKIMHDLIGSPSVVDWTVISAPALFALTPPKATVTRHNSSARFLVLPKGQTTGYYLYRWTTSGSYGELSDLLKNGSTITTTEREVWYFHDQPLSIKDSDRDTITVEVFEVEPGITTIPTGAAPIARMAAEVQGDDRTIDSRIEVNYGATPAGMYIDGLTFGCAEMLLRFKAVPGAKTYTVIIRGVGGQSDERNRNQDFRLRGPNHKVFIDPSAKKDGRTVPDGITYDYHGVCNWRDPDDLTRFTMDPIGLYAMFDRAKEEYVVHLFTAVDYSGIVKNPVSVESRVPLWYDWVADATFEVQVQK